MTDDDTTTRPGTAPEDPAHETPEDATANLRLTPRETGAWELATGVPLDHMPQSYLGALTAWKRAKDAGRPITIDQALDTEWSEIGADLGVVPDPTRSPGGSTPPTRPGTEPNG